MTTQEILQKCAIQGKLVKLPDVQLDRKDYLEVKKALELIGGKWKGGKTMGFLFETHPTALLKKLCEGEKVNLKKEFQFFATPAALADKMCEKLSKRLNDGYKILEPSAGDGALVKAIQRYYGFSVEVDCFEKMELNYMKLAKLEGVHFVGDDFLLADDDVNNNYDIIIANPPFSKNQDILHICKMYNCLRPGGILVTLSSCSWENDSQKIRKEFTTFLSDIDAYVEHVEEGTFKESGTMVPTKLLTIVKPIRDVLVPELIAKKLEDYSTELGAINNNELNDSDGGDFLDMMLLNVKNDVSKAQAKISEFETELNESIPISEFPGCSFFCYLYENLIGVDVTINIKRIGESLKVAVLPNIVKGIKPVVLEGNFLELDEGFLEAIYLPLKEATGLKVELSDYKKSIEAAKKDNVEDSGGDDDKEVKKAFEKSFKKLDKKKSKAVKKLPTPMFEDQ
jgi:PRTRC genetic system protein E